MRLIAYWLAFWILFCHLSLGVTATDFVSCAAEEMPPTLFLREEKVSTVGEGTVLSLGWQDPPAEGFAACLWRLSCSENGRISLVTKGDLPHDTVLTYRLCEGGAVILLDAPKNLTDTADRPLLAVTVEGVGTVTVSVTSATVYAYTVYDEEPLSYAISPVHTEVTLPAAADTAADPEAPSEAPRPPVSDLPEVAGSLGNENYPLYVGCQETDIYQGKFSIRFLFASPVYPADTAVYMTSATGNARVTLEISETVAVTEWTNSSHHTHGASGDVRWYVWTFSGLSHEEKYTFSVISPRTNAVTVYEQGVCQGQYMRPKDLPTRR